MFYVDLKTGRATMRALLDSGASMNFISERVANELRLKRHRLHAGQTILAATVEQIPCTHFVHVYAQLGDMKFYINLRIAPMHPELILGIPFLIRFNPLINWQERSFRVVRNKTTFWIPIVQKRPWTTVNATAFPNDPSPLASSKGIPFPEWEEPTVEDIREVAKLYDERILKPEEPRIPDAQVKAPAAPGLVKRKKKKKGTKVEVQPPVKAPQELPLDLEALLKSFDDVFPAELPTGLPPAREGCDHTITLLPGSVPPRHCL